MESVKWYRVLGKYLWQCRATGLVFLADVCIFALVFSLYDLETEAVAYAGGLCTLFMSLLLTGNFFRYLMAHKRRRRMLESPELLTDELPPPATLAEEDYQGMLRRLKALYDANLTAWENERKESMDYYTTWVHQIKTPISVMRMTLQGEDTEEYRALLAELFRIEQYVGMALNYLRLESDSSDFVFQEYNLDGIIRQAIHKYARQFVRKRIALVYEPANISAEISTETSTEVSVLTDEKWLLFIIEQLLSNAVKYTEKGKVSITVTEGKVLKISDTGIGIAPEDIPRIFEKGFTGYNGRADKKSTGLGLYLCKRTADRLSHKISVESTVGEGSTFSIDLHTDKLETE